MIASSAGVLSPKFNVADVPASEAACTSLSKFDFINLTTDPCGKFPAKVIVLFFSSTDKIVLTIKKSLFSDLIEIGNSKADEGNPSAYLPRYILYISRAFSLSISNKTLPSDFVMIRSGPKTSHPPLKPVPILI